jgi:hypothetical protein
MERNTLCNGCEAGHGSARIGGVTLDELPEPIEIEVKGGGAA